MQTGKQTAIFDCKAYNAKLPKEQWKMKADSENVQVTVTYPLAELPDMFKVNGQPDEFVKAYASRSEKEAASHENRQPVADRVAVRFKVGANCKWFDKFGHACQRPANADLDGKQIEANLDFARKAKNPNDPLSPSGYWVNAIMYRPIEANPFAGQEFEHDDAGDAEPEAEQQPQQPQQTAPAAAAAAPPAAAQQADDEDDLPF